MLFPIVAYMSRPPSSGNIDSDGKPTKKCKVASEAAVDEAGDDVAGDDVAPDDEVVECLDISASVST